MSNQTLYTLGIDLGTSALKVLLLALHDNGQQTLIAQTETALCIAHPHALWSEQNPADWLKATDTALLALRMQTPELAWRNVSALAIAGQMHGAVVLGADGAVLRPAILWNDGRSHTECALLQAKEPRTRSITANRAMAGFTAPKLMWLATHEPDLFARIAKVLLPKDWLLYCLSGVMTSDCSDASGTLWLDVAKRDWSEPMLYATGMRLEQMPTLFESSSAIGTLQPQWAQRWGLSPTVQLIAGAGDNAAAGVALGVVQPEQAFLSLGTSGVIFVAGDTKTVQYANPEEGVHHFCHALPERWHKMAVLLNAASALAWWADLVARPVAALLDDLENTMQAPDWIEQQRNAPLFLPYLNGKRTPHADSKALACLFGLTHAHTQTTVTYSVLEGVAFAFADGMRALQTAHCNIQNLLAVGGGVRSDLWLQLLADVLAIAIARPVHADGAQTGPALGAARLAALGLGWTEEKVCQHVERQQVFTPATTSNQSQVLAERRAYFIKAYAPLRSLYAPSATQ